MDKRGKVVISVLILFIALVGISSYFVLATESNVRVDSLRDAGYSGFEIAGYKVNDNSFTESNKVFQDLNFNSTITKNQAVKYSPEYVNQDIYLTNKQGSEKTFNISIIVRIDYEKINWNGSTYYLMDYSQNNPLKLASWIGNNGNLIVPNIFFGQENKRINYKDVAEQGGYALAYQESNINYIEMIIPNKEVSPFTTIKVDPTYSNATDGFPTSTLGSGSPYGIASNGSDLWIYIATTAKIFHTNKFGTELDSCSPTGGIAPFGLTTNGSDVWFVNGGGDNHVIHFDRACNTLGFFDTDGNVANDISPSGLTTNGSDFWITDMSSPNFLYHTNKAGNNISNGFPLNVVGVGSPRGLVTNGSDFWIVSDEDQFVYHIDRLGNNITDGFSTSAVGAAAAGAGGVAINTMLNGGTPYDFWLSDGTDNFVYHLNCTDCIVPPSTPTLLSPENNSGFGMNSTIDFVWSNSTGSNGPMGYNLEIYNESDLASNHLVYSNYSITEGAQNTSKSIKLSDYTTKDDDYYWRVRANDSTSLLSNWSETRHFQYANWTIIFNLTDSITGEQIDTTGPQSFFNIECNNDFNISGVNNPYNATNKFSPGTWECTFFGLTSSAPKTYLPKTQSIIVDNHKWIIIPMSESGGLTEEEHNWLEELYYCIIGGNCEAYNLWSNTWKRITKTDRAVVSQETFISNILSSNSNITLNYTISIPYKEGYANGEYLPLRLFFWFTNISNNKCYNQDKTTDFNRAVEPYCFPLVAETLGPNNGTVTFRVDLRPSLSDGNYNITRAIEIDPLVNGEQTWTNYGQEDIGQIDVERSNENPSINIDNEIRSNNGFLTGGIIGVVKNLLSGWQIVVIIAILGVVLISISFIISKTLLKLKR